MPYVKNTTHRVIPFTDETPKNEFYVYKNVADLCDISITELKKDVLRCRTLGILHSHYGRFYLTDLDHPVLGGDTEALRISFAFMKKTGPKSTAPSYPLQVFGNLYWKGKPVLYATLLLTMSVPVALRMRDSMNTVVSVHLARAPKDQDQDST